MPQNIQGFKWNTWLVYIFYPILYKEKNKAKLSQKIATFPLYNAHDPFIGWMCFYTEESIYKRKRVTKLHILGKIVPKVCTKFIRIPKGNSKEKHLQIGAETWWNLLVFGKVIQAIITSRLAQFYIWLPHIYLKDSIVATPAYPVPRVQLQTLQSSGPSVLCAPHRLLWRRRGEWQKVFPFFAGFSSWTWRCLFIKYNKNSTVRV